VVEIGYAKIIDAGIRYDGANLLIETDLEMPDLSKVRARVLIRKIEFDEWKQANPTGTLKQFIKLQVKQKYAELKKIYDIAKLLVGEEFSW